MNTIFSIAKSAISAAKVIFIAGFVGGAACGVVAGWSLAREKAPIEFKVCTCGKKETNE